MARNIIVIGGGPAGVLASIEAKRKDPAANVVLLTDESCEPYEKPPLSKAVLLGKALPEDALIAGKGGLAGHSGVMEMLAIATAIDREKREVVLQSGKRLPYDALVLATGSTVRELPILPAGTPRVHYLRTEGHARALKAELAGCQHPAAARAGAVW